MPRLAISPAFPRELNGLAWPARKDVVVAIRRFLAGAPDAPVPERVRHARDPRVVDVAARRRAAGGGAAGRATSTGCITVLPDDRGVGVRPPPPVHGEQRDRGGGELGRRGAGRDRARAAPRGRRHRPAAARPRVRRRPAPPRHRPAAAAAGPADERPSPTSPRPSRCCPETPVRPARGARRGRRRRPRRGGRSTPGGRRPPAETSTPSDLVAALARSPDQAVFASPGTLERSPHPAGLVHLPRPAAAPARPRGRLPASRCSSPAARAPARRSSRCTGPPTSPGAPSGSVLVVTFSQGLAADLSARLDLLIDDEEVRAPRRGG